MKRALRYLLLIDTVALVFFALGVILGIGIGRFQWFPYSTASKIYSLVKPYLKGQEDLDPDRENFSLAFGPETIPGDLIYPEMRNDKDIYYRNREIFVSIEAFPNAFKNINIDGSRSFLVNSGKVKLLEVKFGLEGRQYRAFAYESGGCENNYRAALIIPGSGINQSTKIINKEKDSYHNGITEIFGDACYFVYIKPNEDVLAWHFRSKKLDSSFYVNWHINSGGSYSASYLVQVLAITKLLKTKYRKLAVAGISQGGAAALLTSLQAGPDYAIVASGYNSLLSEHEWSGFDQILIPGINKELRPSVVARNISSQNTEYAFAWGLKEIGSYKVEAINQTFCKSLEGGSPNVSCISHQGGHVVPVFEFKQWLAQKGF